MRQTQCPDCAKRFRAAASKFGERYRSASGKSIVNCVCDTCNEELVAEYEKRMKERQEQKEEGK